MKPRREDLFQPLFPEEFFDFKSKLKPPASETKLNLPQMAPNLIKPPNMTPGGSGMKGVGSGTIKRSSMSRERAQNNIDSLMNDFRSQQSRLAKEQQKILAKKLVMSLQRIVQTRKTKEKRLAWGCFLQNNKDFDHNIKKAECFRRLCARERVFKLLKVAWFEVKRERKLRRKAEEEKSMKVALNFDAFRLKMKCFIVLNGLRLKSKRERDRDRKPGQNLKQNDVRKSINSFEQKEILGNSSNQHESKGTFGPKTTKSPGNSAFVSRGNRDTKETKLIETETKLQSFLEKIHQKKSEKDQKGEKTENPESKQAEEQKETKGVSQHLPNSIQNEPALQIFPIDEESSQFDKTSTSFASNVSSLIPQPLCTLPKPENPVKMPKPPKNNEFEKQLKSNEDKRREMRKEINRRKEEKKQKELEELEKKTKEESIEEKKKKGEELKKQKKKIIEVFFIWKEEITRRRSK